MDANQLKLYEKWVKKCRKQGLLSAKCGDWEFSAPQIAKKTRVSTKEPSVEGLIHDESARMPSDSEMLAYSTDWYDQMQANKKPQKAHNEI